MSQVIALFAKAPLTDAVTAAIEGVCEARVVICNHVHEFLAALEQADVAMFPVYLYDPVVAEALRSAPRLRWIQLLTVGTERLQADPPRVGLQVTNVGEAMAPGVAEHAMALLLALAHGLRPASLQQTQSRWEPALSASITGLRGQLLAVIGYGAIGREIALRARAMGMHVTGLRRNAVPSAEADEVLSIDELDAVLARADAIVITAPLTPQTRGMFDRDRLARCRRGALLVNVGRGAVVETDALVAALESGLLGGVGLDTVDPEPLPPTHTLWSHPNVIITPHVAAAGTEREVARFVAANLERFLQGQPLAAVVAHS